MSLVTGRDYSGAERVQGLHYQISKRIALFPSQHAPWCSYSPGRDEHEEESIVCILGWLEYRGHIDMRISAYFSHRDF